MNSKHLLFSISLIFITSLFGCEKVKEYNTTDLKVATLKNGLPNITGLFNAYKYQDNVSGFVPLEIIEITYDESVNEIVATKRLGDKAVLTDMVTFRGVYKHLYFEVITTYGNGLNFRYGLENIIVNDENTFSMYSKDYGTETKFIRRVEK
jgi:hypothetical protein